MTDGDTVRALDHPYRRSILRVLQKGQITYSDLFRRLEPGGGERAGFNYHLRSLRNADLLQLADSLYSITPAGEAALALLSEVSKKSGARPAPKPESRAGKRGRVRGLGDALRLRRARLNAVLPIGRPLLLVGSVLLLLSLFLPWFTVSSPVSRSAGDWRVSSHDLLPGTLSGLEAMVGFGWFGGGIYPFAALVWLLLIVVLGVASAIGARRFSWFGVSGIAVLALSAVQIYLVAEMRFSGVPSIGLAYGFTLALIGSALIETGARLKTRQARVVPPDRSDRLSLPEGPYGGGE